MLLLAAERWLSSSWLSKQQRRRRQQTTTMSSCCILKMRVAQFSVLLILLFSIPLPSNQVPSPSRPEAEAAAEAEQHQQQHHQLHSSALHLEEIAPLPLPLPLSLSSPNNHHHHHQQQQQQQHPDAPKLTPLSALDRYQEGADLKLFCSASAPASAGRLQFEWRKNHAEQLAGGGGGGLMPPPPTTLATAGGVASGGVGGSSSRQHLHISMMDDSASVLRINHLEADDSGNYTCLARNQHGFDSSTVRVNVNVRLKWIREPASEIQVRAGKSLQLECEASGQPAPLMSWTSLRDRQTISSKVLRIDRVQVNDSGLYECRASSPTSQAAGSPFEQQQQGEQLRKVVKVTVNGKLMSGKEQAAKNPLFPFGAIVQVGQVGQLVGLIIKEVVVGVKKDAWVCSGMSTVLAVVASFFHCDSLKPIRVLLAQIGRIEGRTL